MKKPDDGEFVNLCFRLSRKQVPYLSSDESYAGKMKGIAFIKDPDGYWIEIFDLKRIGTVTGAAS